MLSNRPYLLRAFYHWIDDSNCHPILVIDATHPRCKIPRDYIEGGEIVFNISQAAVRDLEISNEYIKFKASFSGVVHIISAPIKAVLAIYAEENGEGLFFDADENDGSDADERDGSADLEASLPLKTIEGSQSSGTGSSINEFKQKPFLKLVE